ncbi:hypothetical protein GCM10009549_36430 [Streptomyces thermoalcalitolerans]|uniref:Uncharacterized protein n=1 Tax=Streptomyces thermoalcalitolerans TaxID=65605 RepID=A0ABN1NXE8_9ACTN
MPTQNIENGSRHGGRKVKGKIHGEQVTHAREFKSRCTGTAEVRYGTHRSGSEDPEMKNSAPEQDLRS